MWRRLGIERGEGSVVAWGAATLFLVGWAGVSVQNASETYFIKRVGVERLPVAFLISTALLIPTTYVMGRLAARSDRLRLLSRALVVLGLALLPLFAAVQLDLRTPLGVEVMKGIFGLLLVASKQLQSIALLLFFVAMSDLLHVRQAKRLFAPLMAGFTLGTMGGSFASNPVAQEIGIAGLLPMSSLVLVLAGGVAIPLRRRAPARLRRAAGFAAPPDHSVTPASAAAQRAAAPVSMRSTWRESWLFRLLVVTTLCAGLLGPMLYFQFNYVADLATSGSEGESRLLALYSQFRGWLYFGIFLAQLAAVSAIYRRIGVPLAAALAPLVYLLGFLGLSVRLSLPAGVAAMAGTKLVDNSIFDPAQRVLYNLLPPLRRAAAAGFIEGPIKRGGGALGNIVVLAALSMGDAQWVGYSALPIAAFWLVAAIVLWRAYPNLLLQASARVRNRFGEMFETQDLLDRSALRGLTQDLLHPDPEHCRTAIALVTEARAELAAPCLAHAIRRASLASQPCLVDALDRVLEGAMGEPVRSRAAARDLEAVLAEAHRLSPLDRANLVQAYGRLTAQRTSKHVLDQLTRSLADVSPAVRLAAAAALHRRGSRPESHRDLDAAMEAAAASRDLAEVQIVREELRALLLCEPEHPAWTRRLKLLAGLLSRQDQRIPVAEALVEVAKRHGTRVAPAADTFRSVADETDSRLLAALLRFSGHAGLDDRAEWLIQYVDHDDEDVAVAAREGVEALGCSVADVLLREVAYGSRSRRDALLPIARELHIEDETLQKFYQRELDAVRETILKLRALSDGRVTSIVIQRLEERVEEGLHTVLLLLAAMYREDRLDELAEALRRAPGARQRAILLEALDAMLPPRETAELLPLLDDRSLELRAAAAETALGAPAPNPEQVTAGLQGDPDELTRTLAAGVQLDHHGGAMNPTEIALQLKGLPLFEALTTRQLVELAKLVREQEHPAGTRVVEEGGYDSCMFLIVDGRVRVSKGETALAELGPREFFGETAVIDGTTRTADVTTTEPTHLLCLERDDLFRLMEERPQIAIGICQTLSRRVASLNERLQNGG